LQQTNFERGTKN